VSLKQQETQLEWREGRRRRACELKQLGWNPKDIAGAHGVTKGAVSQWMRRVREGGVEALQRQRAKGPIPKLTTTQMAQLPHLLAPGAEAYGYRGQVWTTRRVADLIHRTFGVTLSPDPCQSAPTLGAAERPETNPAGHPAQRDRDSGLAARAVACAEKKATEEQRTLVWIDQSGFYLLPMAVRTYAPRGQTPMLRVKLTRDPLAAISAITPDGRLFSQVQDHAYRSEDVVRFLRLLLRKIQGKLLVIWDGAPIHRGKEIKAFLARGAAKRLHLEQLPSYAPGLNPDEGIWKQLKRVELKNVCCRDLGHLASELRRAKERLRHKQEIIRSCVRQCGYEV
jgi:transposase